MFIPSSLGVTPHRVTGFSAFFFSHDYMWLCDIICLIVCPWQEPLTPLNFHTPWLGCPPHGWSNMVAPLQWSHDQQYGHPYDQNGSPIGWSHGKHSSFFISEGETWLLSTQHSYTGDLQHGICTSDVVFLSATREISASCSYKISSTPVLCKYLLEMGFATWVLHL